MRTTFAMPLRATYSMGKAIIWMFPIVLFISLCELVARADAVSQSVLPTLSSIMGATFDLFQSGQLALDLITSFYRAIAGLTIGSITGITLGVLMARSTFARDVLDPLVTLAFPLPKTAFIPIAVLWLGVGDSSTIFVVVLGTMVPMLISSYHGVLSVPQQFEWSAKAMGASKLRQLTSVLMPASLPYILNGFRISLAFSVVIVISAEMFAANDGVGQLLSLFGEGGNYDYVFAIILTIVFVTFLLDQLLMRFGTRMLRWMENE